MGIKIDLVGQTFFRLKVVELIGRRNLHTYFKCLCECGKYVEVTSNNLRRSHIRSCGCLRDEKISKLNLSHGYCHIDKTAEYRTWAHIKQRCYNNKNARFKDWGGRGIKMCDRWRYNFLSFLEDMGERPSIFHSLDRINPNGDYEPQNCKWSTISEQSRNKRNNVWIEHGGKKMILQDWANYFKVNVSTLKDHMKRKSFEDIVIFYKNKNKTTEMIDNNKTVEFTYVPRNGSDIVYGFFKNGFVKEKDGTIKEVPLSNLPETLKEELRKLIK